MNARACVTTAKTPAAIAHIRLEGPDAAAILSAVLKSPSGKPPFLKTGNIAVINLVDGPDAIDHVVVASPHRGAFDINCHGNPLIVAAIMRLLKKHGAQLITAQQMLHDQLRPRCENTIELETRLHQLTAATLAGVQLVAAQARTGLAAAANRWFANVETNSLESIRYEAAEALRRGRLAKPLIRGCKIVNAGPPNSGKSTLLNALAGRQQAITADVPGTTRDWVTAACRIGPLAVEFIDTAGLDATLAADTVDRAAQHAALQLLNNCDLALLVVDATQPGPIDPVPTPSPTIVVFNKSDLPARATPADLTFQPAATVTISALRPAGLDTLAQAIQTTLATDTLDPNAPTPFTDRQTELLTQLTTTPNKPQAVRLLSELLIGHIMSE